MVDLVSDSVRWLARAAHDGLGLSWGWALVLIGAAARALTLTIHDVVDAGQRRLLGVAAWIPEVLLFVGLVVALAGQLRSDICPAVNPPDRPAPQPCGDVASFALLGDVTAPGAVLAVLFVAATPAAVLWAVRRTLPAGPALIGLAIAAIAAVAVATGTLPFAAGAIAVAACAAVQRNDDR